MQFLAYALVDQHVGVHGHTDGQHDTGDAGQGQGGAEAAMTMSMVKQSMMSAMTPLMP